MLSLKDWSNRLKLYVEPKSNNGLGFRRSNLNVVTEGKHLVYASKNDYWMNTINLKGVPWLLAWLHVM